MNQPRGLFLTVEGGEGVGKSTNMRFVADYLQAQDIPFISTREPGGTPFAEQIRELLLSQRQELVCETTELLLMFAARAQHIATVIEPALQRGEWVLCDRFTDATFAYQGGGRGVAESKIAALEQWVQDSLRPDFTILLDCPVELGMSRVRQRGELDRFEQEQLTFFQSVRDCYLSRAREYAHRFRVIDAALPLEQVQQALQEVLAQIVSAAAASR